MINTSPWSDHVTIVEVLERTASFATFEAVVQAALRRLERDGLAAVMAVGFYADPHTTAVGVLVSFSDYRQMMEHVAVITAWEEFRQLLTVVTLQDVRVYGPLGAEGRAWLHTMNSVSKTFAAPVAGFVRPSVNITLLEKGTRP